MDGGGSVGAGRLGGSAGGWNTTTGGGSGGAIVGGWAAGGGVDAAAVTEAGGLRAKGVPQSKQNFAFGGFSAPQLAQAFCAGGCGAAARWLLRRLERRGGSKAGGS